jgi:hypothetical protein
VLEPPKLLLPPRLLLLLPLKPPKLLPTPLPVPDSKRLGFLSLKE